MPVTTSDQDTSTTLIRLNSSVGRNGKNAQSDVIRVQKLLYSCLSRFTSMENFDIDGIIGPTTIHYIEEFQTHVVGMQNPDGRIDPDGRSWKQLISKNIEIITSQPEYHFSRQEAMTELLAFVNRLDYGKASLSDTPLKKLIQKLQTSPISHPPLQTHPDPEHVTDHFLWSEFACNDEQQTPVPQKYRNNVLRLAKNLEIIREAIGNKSIHINSAYRTPEYNKAIGGSKNSQHCYARAADIRAKDVNANDLHTTIIRLINNGELRDGGVGLYDSFVHYDVRDFSGAIGPRWKG